MIMKYKQAIRDICFLFPWYFLYYVTDLIKKLDYVNCFILFLIRIKFGHAQINMSKIGIPMSKIAFIEVGLFFISWSWTGILLKSTKVDVSCTF